MTIPVYINQEQAGQLTVSQDGLYTVLEAEVPGISDRLIRLWAHGGGKSACLGVMQPWEGGLYLRRRLSRRELAAFPDPIEFISDREQCGAEKQVETKSIHKDVNIINTTEIPKGVTLRGNDSSGEAEKDAEKQHKNVNITLNQDAAECVGETTDKEKGTDDLTNSLHNNVTEEIPQRTDARSCPWPAEPPEEGLLWYRRADGSLTAFDGISSLLAIPAELHAPAPRAAERVIEGKKYLVFRY